MALTRKEVLRQDTFEEQRIKINEVAQDLFDVSTGVTPIDRLLIDGALVPSDIQDSEGSTGKPGQFLKKTSNGLLWKSLSIENVLWVTKDGDDNNDGLSQETAKASIGAALRTANRGFLGKVQDGANNILVNKQLIQDEIVGTLISEYKDFAVGNRFIDAYDDILNNKNFIAEEAVARMLDNNPGFTIPNGNQNCVDDVKIFIETVAFNVKYGGNQKVYDAAEYYVTFPSTIEGERDRSVETYREAAYLMMSVMRHENITAEIVGSHGLTPTYKEGVILDPLQFTSQKALDASVLIENNKSFIAAEAYDRMLQDFPSFTGPVSGTVQDCLDDVITVLDAVKYNLIYGGNDKVYDAGLVYITGLLNGISVSTLADEERAEAASVFGYARDLAIDVIKNITITPVSSVNNTFTQYKDSNIIVDIQNPPCQNEESALTDLFEIIIGAVWDGTPSPNEAAGDLVGVIRTVPTPATTYGKGCSDVASSIYALTQIYFQAIGNDTDGVGNLSGITRTASQRFVFPDSPAESGRFKDARNLIYSNMEEIQDRALAEIALQHPDFYFQFTDSPESQRFLDAANLILANKEEIQDKALAELAVQYNTYPADWIIPGDSNPGRGRFYDAYRLIQLNRSNIIDTAYTASGGSIPSDPGGVKCKRDIGYFVDAISLDVFLGSNIYARKLTQQYFGTNGLLSPALSGEVPQSILAFNSARDQMILAMRNLGVVTDPTVTPDPGNPDCVNVENAITSLSLIVTSNLSTGNTGGSISLPPVDGRDLQLGGSKCRRDIGYLVDALARDVKWETNRHSISFIKKYFSGNTLILNGLAGETDQSIDAFNKARDLMQLAITNQLYVKDLTITPDPDTDDNQDPASCANVQSYIASRILIITDALSAGNLNSLPPLDLGNYPGDESQRYKDSYRLIQKNRKEIIDRSLAEISVQYPDFVYPGDPAETAVARYKDAYRLIQNNRQNIINLAWSDMLIDYPAVSSTETTCKRDLGFFIDAISLDLYLGYSIRYTRKFVQQYFDGSGVWKSNGLEGEELASILAFRNADKFMRAAVSNQSSVTGVSAGTPTYNIAAWYKDLTVPQGNPVYNPGNPGGDVSVTSATACSDVQSAINSLTTIVTDVITAKSLSGLPEEENVPQGRYQDASNLIFLNKNEIADRALAEIAIQHPTFVFPGDEAENSSNRYYDSYRLIQGNKLTIVDDAWNAAVNAYPEISFTETKCKRDLGYYVDALSLDVFVQGNRYTREFTLQYFDANGNPTTEVSNTQKAASLLAFNEASTLMKSAVTNNLLFTDTSITADPNPTSGAVSNTNPNSCANVRTTIDNLTTIVVDVIQNDDVDLLPYVNNGVFNTGINKCKRDIGYLIDGVIDDLNKESNVNSKEVALGYFSGGILIGINGEGAETITAFNKAAEMMEFAVTNQLYKKDLTLAADPLTGDNQDPASCADVRAFINDLVDITTDAIQAELNSPGSGQATVNAIPTNVGVPAPSESKCARDIGYFVDAVSLDIFLGAGNKYSRKLAQSYFITNTVPLYPGLIGEESQSVTAFNMARTMMQKAVTNQLYEKDLNISVGDAEYNDGLGVIPVLESGNAAACIDVQNSIASLTTIITDVLTAGNLNSLPDEVDYEFNRYDDAANLIGLNKNEIQDRALAEIAIQHPDFYFPGDSQSTENSRFFDAYRLIQQNKTEIVDTAFANTESFPAFSTFNFAAVETKCKRDLGYFVDAISLDVFTQGNRYSREFVRQYFTAQGTPLPNGLVGETTESIFAFTQARNLMKQAITNQLTIKDLTVTPDPVTQSNVASNSCANVQTTINNLVSIVTSTIGANDLDDLPALDPGVFLKADSQLTPGGRKCRRDIGYFVDAVIKDLKTRGNSGVINFINNYFDNNGNFVYVNTEAVETITALNKARDVMQQAITNQLYKKDLNVIPDPLTGDNQDPTSCADVQSTIADLTSLATTVFSDGDRTSLEFVKVNVGYPGPTESLCRRDIGYITRSIAEDLYSGGNINSINAVRAYFDAAGAPITNGLVGEEAQSITAFKAAAKYAKKALTNQLFSKDLDLFYGPEEYGLSFVSINYTKSGSDKVCIDVQNAVDNLITIMTTVINDGNLSSLDTITENRGRKGWKITESLCYRDSGYIVDAIATDLKTGGNINVTDVANFYFDNKTNKLIYINGELEQSILAYRAGRDLMKLAVNNWQSNPSNDVYLPKYSFEQPYINNSLIVDYDGYPYCQDVCDSIDNYWNILEYMLLEGGPNSVEVQLPSFKTTVFVKSGVYIEQNPMVLPPSTGIFGDNLRDVSIYPANPTENLIYCENGSYITNVTFSGHLAPGYTCSFPKVRRKDNIIKTGSGAKGSYKITLNNTYGLRERMYVRGEGVATEAIITSIQDKVITLSTANEKNISNVNLTFEYYVGTAGVITRSPYVQNCTSLTTTGSGLCVDGNLASGTASFVLDSYTQYNQGGDGIVIVNGGYTQLVSIFEICCNRAVYLTAGSTCSITNSNTDFGNYGLVADGVGPLQYTCKVDGTQGPGAQFTLKDLPREPYVGQGITIGNNGNPYFFIREINISNGGSGYQTPPSVEIDDPTGPSGIPAQAIANLENGVVTSITLVSSGSQFITAPNITLVGGNPSEVATVEPEMYPQYYSILTSTDPVDGKVTITTDEVIPFDLNDNDEVYFYQLTKIIANSHCMEYVGAGTKIQEAIPARGGVPLQEREVVELNGGKVAFTSTDHLGNFRIGQGLQINQNTGTLSGDSFQRSLFVTVTPFILALS